MKPTRMGQWELDWRESERIKKEAGEAVGYEYISWSERTELEKSLPEAEFKARMEKHRQLELEMNEIWREETAVLMGQGQTLLNIRNNELDAFCSVFQRADRILSGMANLDFGVTEENNGVPAWSDGKSITLNVSAVKQVSPETLSSLHGLNYHELSHLLYTPRVGSEYGAWVKEKSEVYSTNIYDDNGDFVRTEKRGDVRYRMVFNLLEDFRAENYLITKYPSIKDFLSAVVLEYAIEVNDYEGSREPNQPNEFDHAFMIMAGRPHLPKDVIALAGYAYEKTNGIDKTKLLYKLSNEYRTLVFPRDYARAKEIVELLVPILPNNLKLPSGCQERPVLRNGRPTGSKEQEALSEQSKGEGSGDWEELSKQFDEMMSGEPDLDDSEGGEPTDKPNVEGIGYDKGKGSEGGVGKSRSSIQEALANALEQAVSKVVNNANVAKKVAETMRAINKQTSNKSFLSRQARGVGSPEANDVMAVRLFAQELERIRIECDPDWQREVPTGKLNVRRAIQADVNDINKLFDRWTTGNDDYDIEACILLDRSGSMFSQMDNASKATWVIKRAIEKIKGKVSVMTFNNDSKLLYSAEEQTTTSYPVVTSTGGTDPYYGLIESERILSNSKSPTKLLFIVTDGQFYGGKSDEVIQNLKKQGVNTNLVFMSESQGWAEWALANAKDVAHDCHNFRVITNPMELVKVAKDVVRHQIKSNLNKR